MENRCPGGNCKRNFHGFAFLPACKPAGFIVGTPGRFGFRFTNAADTYYGWGSLTVDFDSPGQGILITEAYNNTTSGAGLSVGQVPAAVPEPSSMALLGLRAAGVAAWQARRKAKADASTERTRDHTAAKSLIVVTGLPPASLAAEAARLAARTQSMFHGRMSQSDRRWGVSPP